MIVGLSILAFNLQGILEWIMSNVLLCWEKTSMKGLLRKNLIAHKERNKLTSIIYSLTLACVMFLVTSLNLQIVSIGLMDGPEFDFDLKVTNLESSFK